jgi:DNA-binding CsgD family transcriptional regulator
LIAGPSGHGNLVMQVAATPHLVEAAAAGYPPATGRTEAAAPGDEPVPLAEVCAAFDEWAGRTGRPAWLALRERCRALRATTDSGADGHFREALRQHRAGESDFARAHTELLYGRELRRRRRPRAAREHLRDAGETFRLLGADRWAARADGELRAAGDHPRRPPPGSAPGSATGRVSHVALTAQQERIAALVAGGATNREVAEQLFLSPRTVDHHLRNVFSRLGVRSRTELTRLMIQTG